MDPEMQAFFEFFEQEQKNQKSKNKDQMDPEMQAFFEFFEQEQKNQKSKNKD